MMFRCPICNGHGSYEVRENSSVSSERCMYCAGEKKLPFRAWIVGLKLRHVLKRSDMLLARLSPGSR